MEAPHAIIFYDGLCGLCNHMNPFVLKRDHAGFFRFAPLQSDFARDALARHEVVADDAAMLYVLVNPERPTERLLGGAEAVFHVMSQLGGIWKILSLLRVLPSWLSSAVYALISRNRYRLLGRYESCPLPRPEWRERFLDTAWTTAGAQSATSQPTSSLLD